MLRARGRIVDASFEQVVRAMLDAAEIERRKPVWEALSEFWLDTELSDDWLRQTARVLAASGYTIGELEEIYLYEVAPVVSLNAYSVAGVWDGFDQRWLGEEIARRAKRRRPLLRLLLRLGIGRRLLTWAADDCWLRVVALLKSEHGVAG